MALAAAACESSSVSTVVSPSAPAKCAVRLEHATPSFPAAGGTGAIRVITARECTWSAASEVSWIAIAAGREGQGEGSVAYTVAPNDVAAARRGAVIVGDQRAEIAQEAAPCRFELQPAAATVGHQGGDQVVDVRATKGCDWEARSEAAWIAIVAGGRGTGDGRMHLRAAANPGPARTGTVAVADRRFQWQQAGAPPEPPAPAPTPTPEPPAPVPLPPLTVELEGRAESVSGDCPSVQFRIGSTTIVADRQTRYQKLKCEDLRKRPRVRVEGLRQPDGRVLALAIARADDD
ncbi:MAG TPA: DUF5666 domain-containing protein [Vicinamibacterales bacterium]|nr:DUF5666 domain-containing protein [Vicinamibacterales bacterium]